MCDSAHCTKAFTGASLAPGAATASRQLTRLAGWMSPVAARSAWLSITRGAKAMKPAPRSGSTTMMRAMRSRASPSSSGSPSCSCSASSSGASTHTLPGSGAAATDSTAPSGAWRSCSRPRSG